MISWFIRECDGCGSKFKFKNAEKNLRNFENIYLQRHKLAASDLE